MEKARPSQEGRAFFAVRTVRHGISPPDVPCLHQAKARPHQEGVSTKQHPREHSMKRRDFIKVTGLGVAGAAAVAAPAIAQSMPEIKWRMPTSWPKSLDTLFGGAEMMAK